MTLPILISSAACIVSAATAGAILFFEWRSKSHWLCAFLLGLLSVESLSTALALNSDGADLVVYWQNWGLLASALFPVMCLRFALTFARSNAREHLAHWHVVSKAILITVLILVIPFHDRLVVSAVRANPEGIWLLGLSIPAVLMNLGALAVSVMTLAQFDSTSRGSTGLMAWKIEFMVVALVTLVGARIFTGSCVVLQGVMNLSVQVLNSGALLFACILIMWSLLRAESTGAIINVRASLEQRSSIMLLVLIYFLCLQFLAEPGKPAPDAAAVENNLPVILAGFGLVSAFLVSRSLQRGIGSLALRCLRGPKRDYLGLWRKLSEGLAHSAEPCEVCQSLIEILSRCYEARSVSIWLLGETRESLVLGASTCMTEERGRQLSMEPGHVRAIVDALACTSKVIDLEATNKHWAALIRQLNPLAFRDRADRVCAALRAGDDFLGFLVVGDRVGCEAPSIEDCDLLKSACAIAADALARIRLTRRLAHTKHLEALACISGMFLRPIKDENGLGSTGSPGKHSLAGR